MLQGGEDLLPERCVSGPGFCGRGLKMLILSGVSAGQFDFHKLRSTCIRSVDKSSVKSGLLQSQSGDEHKLFTEGHTAVTR